ncbi:MAG: phosphopyruvate hydratase [Acidimicrobiia bacterium]|nr:phosphopyruvate hydratase [Acidimicrobiia bacterium]
MSSIDLVRGREVLDSRGNPTVEVEVTLDSGARGRAIAPSGASTGRHEAVERRDGGVRFGGKGVEGPVAGVNVEIADHIRGLDGLDQRTVDAALIDLDGTDDKGRLGANALVATSLAVARSGADELDVPFYRHLGGANAHVMPTPMCNVINGGAHAYNTIDIQEFMLVPVGAASFAEGLRWCTESYHVLNHLLRERRLATGVGDEGGFAPDLGTNEDGLRFLVAAIEAAGYIPGKQISLALDVAATELWRADTRDYELAGEGRVLSAEEMVAFLTHLVDHYPLVSIEDPMAEDDWEGWAAVTAALGDRVQVVGDDLFVTNTERLERGIAERSANAILIKFNQVGTLTETLDTVSLASRSGLGVVVSHRSGESEDTAIADLAVAVGCGQIKAGAPARTDRVAKYNQLLRIEEELGQAAAYRGGAALAVSAGRR